MYTFYYQKPTEIEINIERRQKQVIDVYLHLLKAPSSKRSRPKRLFERFYPMDLFSGFYGIYKNLVLNYNQSRVLWMKQYFGQQTLWTWFHVVL